MGRRNLLWAMVILISISASAQREEWNRYFSDVELKIDTSEYHILHNSLIFNNQRSLAFRYDLDESVSEIYLYPNSRSTISKIKLIESADFSLLDSLVNMNQEYYRFKVKFRNLTLSQFLQFTFVIREPTDSTEHMVSIRLFPYTSTFVKLLPGNEELYIGEEKIFELSTNNKANVKLSNDWTTEQDIDYLIDEKYGQLRLHLLPHGIGRKKLEMTIQTLKPYLDDNQRPVYSLPIIVQEFVVKTSRLAFLNLDKKEVTLDAVSQRAGIEVQIDENRSLVMGKTYRIEDQEKPGGALIAELFTRNSLANNRVLCLMHLYNFHRQSEGYLYIKDGDDPKYITNINVTPKTSIKKISLLHEGGDWTENLNVSPGETFIAKLEGEGLHKAKFIFEDLKDVSSDSAIRIENLAFYKLTVPMNLSKKRISIFNYGENTGLAFQVKEYQLARTFDYMQVNYGDIDRTISALKSPILYPRSIKDITFDFIPRRIDEDPHKLFGKQYLKVDVTLSNSKGQMLEMRTLDNIVVCPGDNSPRFNFYDTKDCKNDDISINSIVSRKTYDLEDWSKIELNIQNKKEKYGDEVYSKKIEIYLQQTYKFDIDVSFPGGLITVYKQPVKGDTTGRKQLAFGSLSGISMAVMGQFSFYDPDKIAKLRPYKIGFGFLALNAFNFSSGDVNRDVGLVIIGSIYPINREAKLSFPLYMGFGYLLKAQQPFFLIGPGISVQL
jgi:hypothetical protein